MATELPTDLHVHLRVEDGAPWATVAEFPGVFATGDTIQELTASLEEGIALYLTEGNRPSARVTLSGLASLTLEATAELALA